MQMAGRYGAARGVCQLPAPFAVALHNAFQARTQVAVDGADAHLKVVGQLALVDGVALVQAGQDLG